MDNAAARENFASEIYTLGVNAAKAAVLDSLPQEIAELHRRGDIHIHDLEAFGKIYNCSTPDIYHFLSNYHFTSHSDYGIIEETFEAIRFLLTQLATVQSGGIGFGNLDIDVERFFDDRALAASVQNIDALNEAVARWIRWINNTRTRFCRETYYVTVNLGLAAGVWGRELTKALLTAFETSPAEFTKPNIVFKVSNTVNGQYGTQNYDLYQMALHCTAKRMIPTYLLLDSETNCRCKAEKLNIMGCRTRVYDNLNGNEGTIGRGNLAYASINLPRIALSTRCIEDFFPRLHELMNVCFRVMDIRNQRLLESAGKYLDFAFANGIWADVSSVTDMVSQGTRSVGFIGLSETVWILTNKKMYEAEQSKQLAFQIIRFMNNAVMEKRRSTGENYSLLATPGEMLSGRFCELDKVLYPNSIQEKGYYTNSFHVDVDSRVSVFDKLRFEGQFHSLCNGGSISYVEFASALLENTEAVSDIISFAVKSGISYLGINFPLDICNACGNTGTFDNCTACGSRDIHRIRRVSGYLEDSHYFTSGKKAEIKNRRENPIHTKYTEANVEYFTR